MCGVWCSNCKKLLSVADFDKRDDSPGLMAFCRTCCIEQGRTPDYPPKDERGYGRFVRNWELG